MLTISKMKKTFLAVGVILAFSASQANAKCMPVNPICLFKMILKATPGMPVMDFTSIPAIIPHVPAALLKEGQAKLKEIADNALEKLRSGQLPSLADIKLEPPSFSGGTTAANEDYASLEAFPSMDAEDPMAVAKAVEVIFLRPGWNDEKAPYTKYDRDLMSYYQNQFDFNNVVEVLGFNAYMENKLEELMTAAEDIQKQIDSADDLNKAQRANYAAHLMEYQLMIVQNQLLAASLQADTAAKLKGIVLNKPIFSNM
ncbi:MAG: hypothetical protein IJ752_03595 [Alphaproteobacteria bacterium]|nr:hypothetical protein [Alphaproteobacteria bacterium]